MAQRKYFVDLDLNKNYLKQARLENTVVSGVSGVSGQVAFDTATNKLAFYNGTSWEVVGQLDVSTVDYKGGIAYDASEPSPKDTGDMYIFTTAGTVTWASNAVVQAGDFVIYDGTKWDVIQKNVEAASESVAGYVQLATDSETNAGTVNSKAVSPRRLSDYRLNKKLASAYVVSNTSISTSGTNIDHNLNSDLAQVSVYDSDGYQIEVQVLIASNNRVTLTSGSNLSNCKVVVIGHNITDPNA
jgi:hypothetical protein